VGQHQLTVTGTYAGVTQTYTFPIYVVSFTGSLSSSTLTVARGGTGTLTATLNASTGFSDSVHWPVLARHNSPAPSANLLQKSKEAPRKPLLSR
jgi:hypothetical protein